MVDQAIWSKKMSNGTRRIPVSPEQVRLTLQIYSFITTICIIIPFTCSSYITMQIQDGSSLKRKKTPHNYLQNTRVSVANA